MSLISSAIAESLREQDLIPDALENLAKSSTRGLPKPEQTSLPLKQTDLYYDKERRDFFVKSDTVEEQPVQLFNEVDNSVKEVDNQQTSVKYAQRSEVDNQDDEHDNLDFKKQDKKSNKNELKVLIMRSHQLSQN